MNKAKISLFTTYFTDGRIHYAQRKGDMIYEANGVYPLPCVYHRPYGRLQSAIVGIIIYHSQRPGQRYRYQSVFIGRDSLVTVGQSNG